MRIMKIRPIFGDGHNATFISDTAIHDQDGFIELVQKQYNIRLTDFHFQDEFTLQVHHFINTSFVPYMIEDDGSNEKVTGDLTDIYHTIYRSGGGLFELQESGILFLNGDDIAGDDTEGIEDDVEYEELRDAQLELVDEQTRSILIAIGMEYPGLDFFIQDFLAYFQQEDLVLSIVDIPSTRPKLQEMEAYDTLDDVSMRAMMHYLAHQYQLAQKFFVFLDIVVAKGRMIVIKKM